MPVLYRRHNYGVVTLEQTSVDYLPVGLPDGSERFSNWRGFIDHHTAWFLQAEGLATPVVLPCCSWEPTRFSGARRREGALTCMIPALPLAQSTPLFTGWSRLPSI